MPSESISWLQYLLFEELIEPLLIQPTFITDLPIEASPLAFSEDGERIDVDSLSDSEIFNRIHCILSEEKKDEIEAEIEDDKASNQSFLINKY